MAEIGRCKDCKFRVAESCNNPKHLLGYAHPADTMAVDGLQIENDEGWGWIIGPEFGCVNFERVSGQTGQSSA
jgi:hypothetical protein